MTSHITCANTHTAGCLIINNKVESGHTPPKVMYLEMHD